MSGRKPDQRLFRMWAGHLPSSYILWEEWGLKCYIWEPAIQANILILKGLQSFQINQLDRNCSSCITAFQQCLHPALLVSPSVFLLLCLHKGGCSSVFFFLLFQLEFRLIYFPVVSIVGTKLCLWWAPFLVKLSPWAVSLERSGDTHTHTEHQPSAKARRWEGSWMILILGILLPLWPFSNLMIAAH